jgi:glycosyltransferase involved in cell wall biosynthesis
MEPKVTVVMPCLNERRYLGRSIGSIQGQSFAGWELIVIDDGSTDGSAEFVEELGKQDGRIKLVRNRLSHGTANALNVGIQIAKGEYIARLDADDEAHPDRLGLMTKYLDGRPEVGVVGCGLEKRRWRDGVVYDREYQRMPDSHDALVRSLGRMVAIGANCMVRTAVIERVGGYNPCIGAEEELEFVIRAAEVSQLGYIGDYLYVYNLISGKGRSLSGWGLKKKWVMAKLNVSAIRRFDLPKTHYLFPLGWLIFGLLPSGGKQVIRRLFGKLIGREAAE